MSDCAYAAYRQTTDFTCALCSYMVAHKEMSGCDTDRGQELTLWFAVLPWYLRRARVLVGKYIGTPPLSLARMIMINDRDLTGQLMFFHKNTSGPQKPSALVVAGCWLHDQIFTRLTYLRPRVQRFSRQQNADDVLGAIRDDGARLLQVVTFKGGQVHFVLIRKHDSGGVIVMDPWVGKNSIYTEDEFRSEIGPKLFGYAIRLTRDVDEH